MQSFIFTISALHFFPEYFQIKQNLNSVHQKSLSCSFSISWAAWTLLHIHIFQRSARDLGRVNMQTLELPFYTSFFKKILSFGCVGSSLLYTGFLQLRRAGATLCCGAQASHCGGFSCCRAPDQLQTLGLQQLRCVGSVVVAHGLQSTGSVVVAHGLSCLRHVGSFRTRARTVSPALAGGFLTTAPPGKPLYLLSGITHQPHPPTPRPASFTFQICAVQQNFLW